MTPYGKTIIRSVRQSLGRFIAILAIIALGVGFLAGLIQTSPSFMKTGNAFINTYKLYDFRLLSTIGFDDEDIEKLGNSLEDLSAISGAYLQDVSARLSGGGQDDTRAVRIHSITTGVNELKLESGRMPSSPKEIVVDGYNLGDEVLGQTLILDTGDTESEEYTENLKYTEFTIVGTVRSPYYLNFTRGTTEVGSGQISYFAYVLPEAFDSEYYSEVYLYYDTGYEIYSDEYDEWSELKSSQTEPVLQEIIDERFDGLLEDSLEEIEDARQELDEARVEALEELSDAWDELQEAQLEIDDAGSQLSRGQSQISSQQSAITGGLSEISSNEEELNRRQRELDASSALVEAGITASEAAINQLNQTLSATQAAGLTDQVAIIQEGINQTQQTLNSLYSQRQELADAQATIDSARAQLESGRTELNNAQSALSSARNEYNSQISEYEDAQMTLFQAKAEYYGGVREFSEQMAQATRQLDYACRTVANVDDPDTYVLGRDTNAGYLSFNNDANIVAGIARVFPLFFFAIASLVCSTTMQRMVSDERGIIGTMRAMGFSDFAIMMKYVIYAGLAAVTGCIGGYFLGLRIFPYLIWDVYGMMYGFTDLLLQRSAAVFVIALVVSVLCSVGVTIAACRRELSDMPAQLIRPKAPMPGKKILLEKISFIWKRLKFTHKVSLRNVFRFKKRMWMMLLGIAGCSALLITGFGIRDSVVNVVDMQYDDIMTYDIEASIKDSVSVSTALSVVDSANKELGTNFDPILIRSENVTHTTDDAVRDVTLIVSGDSDISKAMHGLVDGQEMDWPGDGKIAISSKLARKASLEAGDKITLGYGDTGETFTAEISYVFDNYVYHYAFMNEATYEKLFGVDYRPSGMLIVGCEGDEGKEFDFARILTTSEDFKNISVISESRESFSQTMQKMDVIVVLIICCAAALAFIVLFNLNNINITERIREIATIKVLGFSGGETGSYFFRENFILVFMGFLLGVPLGILLHSYVIGQVEMDMVTFPVQIYFKSYIFALIFVILFSVLVDLVMRVKISRIDMAESLKSAE